jgi:outer membrane protein assembly factor BamB
VTEPREALAARWIAVVSVLAVTLGALGMADAGGADAAGDDEGSLVALDPATGTEQWRVPSPGEFAVDDVSKSVVVGRGYSCRGDHFEYVAYRASDGRSLWRAPAPQSEGGSAATNSFVTGSARSGVVVLRTPGHLVGRNARSGHVRWQRKVAHHAVTESSATRVLVSTGPSLNASREAIPGRVEFLDRATGDLVWSKQYPSSAIVTASLGATVAVVTITTRNMFDHAEVVDLRSGRLRWQSDLPLVPTSDAVVVATAVPNPPHAPRGHAASDGRVLWDAPDEDLVVASPGFFAFWRSGLLSAADANTGVVRWSHSAAPSPLPLTSDRIVVVQQSEGSFDVLASDTGTTRWQRPPGSDRSTTLAPAAIGRSVYAVASCVSPPSD